MRAAPPEVDPFIQALERADAEHTLGAPFADFERIVVLLSGGKDSIASILHLLDLGVPRHQIELWHHEIDEPGQPFMDWPCTPGYCRAVADALGLPLLFSRREGGFLRELRRYQTPTAPVRYESLLASGRIVERVARGTQRRSTVVRSFPALGAIESGRWCSAVLKIDVGRRVFANDPRFVRGKYLYISGERREEGGRRKSYREVERDVPSSNRYREVVRWRAVIDWPEERVWDALRRWRIRPHVGYELGWSRLSCSACVFGGSAQFASMQVILPEQFHLVAEAEAATGATIKPPPRKRKRDKVRPPGLDIVAFAAQEAPFLPSGGELRRLRKVARTAGDYRLPVVLTPREAWEFPRGAFKSQGGPT